MTRGVPYPSAARLYRTLWFLPSETDADRLAHGGVGRGRTWTPAELMAMPRRTPETLKLVGLAKVELEGDVVEVTL